MHYTHCCSLIAVFRRIVKLSTYEEEAKSIFAIARVPMSVIGIGPAYKTADGQLDRLACARPGSEKVLTVWMVGTIDSTWFTSPGGDVQQLANLTIKLLDNHSQGLANSLLSKFTKTKEKSEALPSPFIACLTLLLATAMNNARPGYAKFYAWQNIDRESKEVRTRPSIHELL